MDGYERNLDAGHALLNRLLPSGSAIGIPRAVTVPAKELLRYALSLDGVNTAIVGLDGPGYLNLISRGFSGHRTVRNNHLATKS